MDIRPPCGSGSSSEWAEAFTHERLIVDESLIVPSSWFLLWVLPLPQSPTTLAPFIR
jgi:hypothetical protein